MRNLFGVTVVTGILLAGSLASAQFVNVQDFEAGTNDTLLPGNWAPHISGTSTGNIEAGTDTAKYSNEQAHGGTLSGKIFFKWVEPGTNLPKRVRIQPAAAGWITDSNATIDRTSTPFAGFYLYGAATGDQVSLYMGEGALGNGASPYEEFTHTGITWTGWKLYERNILSSPVTAFVTGDGTLSASNSISGLFFYPPADNLASAAEVTVYVDDFGYSATTRAEANVPNWSVY